MSERGAPGWALTQALYDEAKKKGWTVISIKNDWGDAENTMNEWATMAATKLSSWTSGAVKPS